VSGRYFDGFKEIPSSEESRDEQKARAVWEQSAKLAGISPDDSTSFPLGVPMEYATNAGSPGEWENVGEFVAAAVK